MIEKEVQKCVAEAFQAQFTTYCHDNKLDSDDNEQHQIEPPLKLDLEDIMSENYNLSDLRQPQTKHDETHHLCPITTAFVET
jgi:hypothetical protein